MVEMLRSLRRPLIDALEEERDDDATQVLAKLEDQANAALATGELAAIVSARGQLSRLRRAAVTADPQWQGVQRMLLLDRALGSAITGMQLALRRELPVPIPEHVSDAANQRSPPPTIRQLVLNALDDKPRRPIDLGQRTGVSKRQLQRALRELVATGRAQTVVGAVEDARAAFYQRVV